MDDNRDLGVNDAFASVAALPTCGQGLRDASTCCTGIRNMATNVIVLLLFSALTTLLVGAFAYLYGRGRPRPMDLERIAELEAELAAERVDRQA